MTIHFSPTDIAEDDRRRSRYIKDLFLRKTFPKNRDSDNKAPRILAQFWDDPHAIPDDVKQCIDSWTPLEQSGFTQVLFNNESARQYIREHFSPDYLKAYDNCPHPAMRSDFFRLCFIYENGGVYIDADDEYTGKSMESVMERTTLQVQVLCYDTRINAMCNAYTACNEKDTENKIFYLNNNPLISSPHHPIIKCALLRATAALIQHSKKIYDIQEITGPGNLTFSLVHYAAQLELEQKPVNFILLRDWEKFAVSKWPLSYREDDRNWRIWSEKQHLRKPSSNEQTYLQ